MKKNTILVISSTNRPNSLSQTVASYYTDFLASQGIPASLLTLSHLPADFTHSALYGNQGKNEAFNKLAHQVALAPKLVFVVPQYHGSFPGVLKAFIDGLYQPKKLFSTKKCALVGVSQGRQGAIIALSHLTDIFHYLGMCVYPVQPKLSSVADTTIEAVRAHPHYLERLHKQALGFIHF